MSKEIERLKKLNNFGVVHNSKWFQENFVYKYFDDIPKMALDLFNIELTYQQDDVMQKIEYNQGRLVVPSGHGCHGVDTPIMMSDGSIKKVQDVEIGDKLMGDDGKSERNVLSLARGQEEMFKFLYADGTTRIYNKSHVLYLYSQPKMSDIIITVGDLIVEIDASGDEYFDDYHAYKYCFGKEKAIRLDIDEVNYLKIGNYYGFELDGNHKFLDGDFIVTHNTGKTLSIGVISSCFLLLFPESITRIQAPTEQQIINFSFKEIENCFNALSSYRRVEGRLVRSEWYWLTKYFQFNAKKIFVKGFSRSWYCEAKTAPKGKSENLSGQHKWAYQLIIDEASGVEDEHINASMGALSNYFNSAILFSQHTRLTGLFNDFVTVQNKDNGGLWSCVRLNSEQSPIVDISSIKNWRETYNESQYAVRVNGLPPLYVEGNLISPTEALSVFNRKDKGWIESIKFNTLVVTMDTAYRGIRDSSVVTVAKVAKVGEVIYVVVLEIAVFHGKNAKMPTATAEEGIKSFLKYEHLELDNTILCYDASSGGREGYTRLEKRFGFSPIDEDDDLESHMVILEKENLEVVPIVWGSDRLTSVEKKDYVKARDKAFGGLQRAVMNTRNSLYILDQKHKTRTVREMSNIPFKYTSSTQLKIAAKEDFEIGSPDIVDTIAQIYLLNFDEVEIDSPRGEDEATKEKSEIDINLEISEKNPIAIEDLYSHML